MLKHPLVEKANVATHHTKAIVGYPQEWDAFASHYRNDSPWFGSARIFVRKGKLTADGTPLTPLGDGLFRAGAEEWSPERLGFGPPVNGRAMRMKVSGVEFYRTSTP